MCVYLQIALSSVLICYKFNNCNCIYNKAYVNIVFHIYHNIQLSSYLIKNYHMKHAIEMSKNALKYSRKVR